MLNDLQIRLRSRWTRSAVLDQDWISEILSCTLLLASIFPLSVRWRLALRVAGIRRTQTKLSRGLARVLLNPVLRDQEKRCLWRKLKIGWQRYYGDFTDITQERTLTTSLVLKAPGLNGEKGVLYSSFEFNWMRLLANHDMRSFLNDYWLVGASSWSPGDHAVLASLQGLSDDPVFVGVSHPADMEQYSLWEPGIVPLPITAGDWIDPAFYEPRPHAERDIDILMVSHFASWKRHWLLFEALRDLPADLRVVLVGRETGGRTEEALRQEAKAYGVRQKLVIYKNLEIEEVSALQCRARVAVALSRREGSCVSVTEALFSDALVVVMDDAHIGTRQYINESTGSVCNRKNLGAVLGRMIASGQSYSPRRWALDNISAESTSKKLNDILRTHCQQRGLPWTRDIVPMCWRYVPAYLNPEDKMRMREAEKKLRDEHNIALATFPGERAVASDNKGALATSKVA